MLSPGVDAHSRSDRDETLIESLEIAKDRIRIMIEKGMDNEKQVLQGLIDIADKRIAEIRSGEKPALKPDADAKYYAEAAVEGIDLTKFQPSTKQLVR